MAEIAVGMVVDHLIPVLIQEASLLRSVHSNVWVIKRELEMIQCFLRDADRRAEAKADTTPDGVTVWVKQVREVAFQIEDVIDDYILYLSEHPRRHGFLGFLHKIGRAIDLKPRYNIASHIQDINTRVREIKERSERYGFDSIHYQQERNDMSAPFFMEEAQVVGIEFDRDKLTGWLVDRSPDRTVVAVVGMGGLGKTTLAKCVYDSLKEQSDCHACWITVSQSYDKKELLEKLMDKFGLTKKGRATRGTDEVIEMITSIREFLQNRRYVVFFDDVWKIDFWSDIEHALFDNKKGGRIVLTTRNSDVANFCKASSYVHVHMLQPMAPEKAWQLFCNKAFQFESERCCPPELEHFSHKIVERCEGLPLAIVAVAGLLSTKEKTVEEWRKLHDNLSSKLESNPHLTIIMRILSLSYIDLPCRLKSCFLYFGLYPADYLINCPRLIPQWVSEGFITTKKKEIPMERIAAQRYLINEEPLEVVAQGYLNALINRSLVQVSRKSFKGKAKECRIHNLVHEVILKKIRHLQFGSHLTQSESSSTELTRLLSIGNASVDVLETMENSRVRAILIFNKSYEMPVSLKATFIANFKLLKLLDFEYASGLAHLPEDIGILFHLRYLSVAHTKVEQLPRSIGKLQNLETLDLKWSLVHDLPVEINRLHKLRHLLAYRFDTKMNNFLAREGGVKVKSGFGCLAALQKLYYIESTGERMVELKKLTKLRKLGIFELKTTDGGTLCECINEMKLLESLQVSTKSEGEIIDLDSVSSSPIFLRCLILKGRLTRLPEWINYVHGLAKLELVGSRLQNDPLGAFPNLPSILSLVMVKISHKSYDTELHFKREMFPSLKYLYLQRLSQLNSLVIEEGAMPIIEELTIEYCCRLKYVPDGIQHLRSLKKLSLLDMPDEVMRSVKPGGQHYRIVRHVSEVVSVHEVYDLPTAAASTSSTASLVYNAEDLLYNADDVLLASIHISKYMRASPAVQHLSNF